MRGLAYVIAAFASLGIMYVIATSPDQMSPDQMSADQEPAMSSVDTSSTSVASTEEIMDDAGTLTLSVPEMHCEFACFPKVKETLEQETGVEEVTLAAQKEEGVLDNRQVIVKYQAGFNPRSALKSLEAAGYKDSGIVQ